MTIVSCSRVARAAACMLLVLSVATTPLLAQLSSDTSTVTFAPFTLTTRAHGAIAAEIGTLRVPSRHREPNVATLTLRFVRLKAASASSAPPVIYLAGGPGGSGIDAALGVRWPVFDGWARR